MKLVFHSFIHPFILPFPGLSLYRFIATCELGWMLNSCKCFVGYPQLVLPSSRTIPLLISSSLILTAA